MKSSFNKMLLTMALTSSIAHADLPVGWLEQAQRLVDLSTSMKETLDSDKSLYSGKKNEVTASFALIEDNNKLRQETFECMRSRFNEIANAVVQCQADTTTIITNGQNQINSLYGQLIGLKNATDAQISSLIAQKQALEAEYADWVSHFNTDVGEYAEEADAIIKKLRSLASSFDSAMVERVNFTNSVDELVSKMRVDAKEELADVYDANSDLCKNAPKVQPMPVYTPITYSPIQCPSDEYLAEKGPLPAPNVNSSN